MENYLVVLNIYAIILLVQSLYVYIFNGDRSPFITPQKRQRGKQFSGGEKQMILNLYSCEKLEHPTETRTQLADRVGGKLGICGKSAVNILKEKRETGTVKTPVKKKLNCGRNPGQRKRTVKYDGIVLHAIRRTVHSFFFRNEPPTLEKVLKTVNEDNTLPMFSKLTLYRVLCNDLSFVYVRRNRNSMLLDREDLITWRRKYLRDVQRYRLHGRPIIYMDGTWVNAGHTTSKAWKDSTILSKKQAFLSGLSTGLKDPSGKGERLILIHAGNENGFVDGAMKFWKAGKSDGDYHESMDGKSYLTWFEIKLLPNLPTGSVIVIDNAPYHIVLCEKIPTKACLKADIINWLVEKNLSFDPSMVKKELMDIVYTVRPKYTKYIVDELATKHGHVILRLHPYHCELNPIEMVWAQVKGHVARNNRTFKLAEVERLLAEGISRVTKENWTNYVAEVVNKVEEKMRRLDCVMDVIQDEHLNNNNRVIANISGVCGKLIINIGDTSSDDSCGSNNYTDSDV